MSQQPPPPGGWPQQPNSPTQPNWQPPAGGPQSPSYQGPPVPPPGGYPPPPPGGYPPQTPGGYPPQPTYQGPPPPGGYPPQGYAYQPPPPPPENHTSRNVVIGVVVALFVILLLGSVYAATRPQPSLPVLIPTLGPSAEATRTPKPTKEATAEPATEQPPSEEPATEVPATDLPATEAPATVVPQTEAPATDVLPTEAPPTEAAPTPSGSTIPGVEDQQIVIGDPVVIGDSAFQQVALLTQNVSDLVKSYSLKGTFKNGDTITATAVGFVSDHLPGTIRTPALYIDGTPGASDTLTVAIDSMLTEDPSTPGGDVAQQVTFGPPTINAGDFPSIDVEVTNGSQSTVSLSVSAGVMRDGVLVGVGSGFVSDMSAGQTKTASLYVTGDLADTDQLILTVENVLIQ